MDFLYNTTFCLHLDTQEQYHKTKSTIYTRRSDALFPVFTPLQADNGRRKKRRFAQLKRKHRSCKFHIWYRME